MDDTVARALANGLAGLGTRHAFGVSGGAIAFFWSALGESGLTVTHFRHESGAAFAAGEASIATDRPVVVFVTTGPGLTNVLTGVYAARHETARIVVVSAHTDEAMLGRFPIQETGPRTLPQEGVFTAGPLFDHAVKLDSADQLPAVLQALADGLGRPEGFVAHVSLSLSVQRQPAVAVTPERASAPRVPGVAGTVAGAVAGSVAGAAADVYDLLRERSWVMWVGNGARRGAEAVRRLARAAGAPVMATPRGKGVVAETDPAYLGVTGFGGHPAVLAHLDSHRPEYILVLGSGLGDFATGYLPGYLPTAAFVQVDVDPSVPGRAYPETATMAVHAEVGAFCAALAELFETAPAPSVPATPPTPLDRQTVPVPVTGEPVHPGHVMDAVQAVFVDGGVPVLAETGNTLAWAINRLRFADPAGWRSPSGLVGSMGHFSAGVVGVALATSRPAVALVGDGAMLMCNEVSTAVQCGAPAIWVVLNDSRYNMCKQGTMMLGLTNVDCDMPETDFAAFATALGAQGTTVRRAEQLVPALTAALTATLASAGPVVVDVRIDAEQLAPLKGRIAGLLRDSAAEPGRLAGAPPA